VSLATTLLGSAACALDGGLVAAGVGLAVVLVLLGRRLGSDGPVAVARWRVLNTSALVLCVLAAFARVPLLAVGIGLVTWLQVHRAWTGRSAREDRIALLLALLQALLGCIVSVSPLLAPLFLGLAVLAPVGLALCHLGIEGEGARTARIQPGGDTRAPTGLLWGLGPVTALLTVVFFVALPRLDGGARLAATAPQRITGFGDDVDIGDLGELLSSDEPVLRVRVVDAQGGPWSGPLYLRGAALDHFDGQRWTATVGPGARWRTETGGGAELVRQEILLEPLSENVIFGLAEVVRVQRAGRRIRRDANGTLRIEGPPARLRYTAWSRPPEGAPSRLAQARPDPQASAHSRGEQAAAAAGSWLQLPADFDPRIPALAAQAVAELGPGASAWDQAQAISSFLQARYHYSLAPTMPADGSAPADPLAWFLFDSHEGHCEYFATALAVMLRTRGIPARVVNGFLGGEYNALGDWVLVRQRDAHSWVELNLGTSGWVTVDATPAGEAELDAASLLGQATDWLARSWHGAILDYELSDQLDGLAAIGSRFAPTGDEEVGGLDLPQVGGIVAVAVGGLLVALLLRAGLAWAARAPGRPRSRSAVDRVHERAWRWVHHRGWAPPSALPPVEAAAWVRERAGGAAAPLERLAWLHYGVRYGGAPEAAALAEARRALRELRRGLPRGPGPADPLLPD